MEPPLVKRFLHERYDGSPVETERLVGHVESKHARVPERDVCAYGERCECDEKGKKERLFFRLKNFNQKMRVFGLVVAASAAAASVRPRRPIAGGWVSVAA